MKKQKKKIRSTTGLVLIYTIAAICKLLDLVLGLIDLIPQSFRTIVAVVLGVIAVFLALGTAGSSDLNMISMNDLVRNIIIIAILFCSAYILHKGSRIAE